MKRSFSTLQRAAAAAAIATMLAPLLILRADPPTAAPKALTEDQKVLHVLNRLGYGARPGDVERVKAMGVQKYIDQQLNPSSINDSAAEAKVKNLDIFNMSTSDLFAKYPNPGALLRQLDGGKKNAANNAADAKAGAATAQQDPTQATADQQKERRQKIQQIYAEYNLKPAGQLMPQIVANRVLRAVYSERQLQETMVDFWQNHFNVFSGKGAVRWYIPSYEETLRKNALGNFRDLLLATAEHPAMLFFLDNYQSVSPTAPTPGSNPQAKRMQEMIRSGQPLPPQMRERLKRQFGVDDAQLDQRLAQMRTAPQPAKQAKRGINENYARELMELHTLGVNGGYTQNDIIEVAKCFTGWTIFDPTGYRRAAASMIKGSEDKRVDRLARQPGVPDDIDSGQFYFNKDWHVTGPKTVLGQKIDEGGMKDGLKVIDMLVESPATAKFIARKLAVKFVSDDPSDELVNHVADAFHSSHGDIKTTLRALFSDKEFFAPENYRAKIKSPFELAISSIRTIGADTTASPAFLAMLNKLGEVPYGYQAPTGYPDKNEDWVNTGALLERLNFAVALASNRIPGTHADLGRFRSASRGQMLDNSIDVILDGQVSDATRAMLTKQMEQALPDVKAGAEIKDPETMDVPNMRAPGQAGAQFRQARLLEPSGDPEVFKAVSLVLGTPEFQRQ